MGIKSNILVIDDNFEICELIKDILKDEGYGVMVAHNTRSALEAVEKIYPSLIIVDMWLEGNHMDGVGLLKKLKQLFPSVPVIMISGHANVELAALTMKLGAYDFIEKPFKTEKLLIIVKRALETKNLIETNNYLQQNPNSISFKPHWGNSKNAQKLRQEIKSLATSNCRVVITGENGCNQTEIAKEIHDSSPRAHKSFISLSTYCAMYDKPNISEIIAGNDNTKSIFERADGGTLVLENLHLLPMNVQNKILEILQKEVVIRGGKANKFDVRIMGAFEVVENFDLTSLIKKRALNEMLYYRLNVKTLTIPSLKNRSDDIPILFDHAVRIISEQYEQIKVLDVLYHILTSYEWPCNTKELCNIAEYAVIMAKVTNSDVLSSEHLPQHFINKIRDSFGTLENIVKFLDKDYKSAKKQFDTEYINAQLRKNSYNVAKTARSMDVDRAALYRKIRSLGPKTIGRGKKESYLEKKTYS